MRPLIVGIAGGSGSGKTHLANQIVDELGNDKASLLSMDQYFKSDVLDPSKSAAVNFDHPSHLDFDRMMDDVHKLREGESVWTPTYDFNSMQQTSNGLLVSPNPVVIVEGLFVLADPMVSLCDLTCFLDVAADERLLGRILRDVRERGAVIEEVIDRYQRFVRPSYHVFVSPTKQNADVVLNFTYRRALFSQMLISLLRDFINTEPPIDEFVGNLRREGYLPSIHHEDGFMSMTTDIFELARAYPEKGQLRDLMSSPAATSLGRSRER